VHHCSAITAPAGHAIRSGCAGNEVGSSGHRHRKVRIRVTAAAAVEARRIPPMCAVAPVRDPVHRHPKQGGTRPPNRKMHMTYQQQQQQLEPTEPSRAVLTRIAQVERIAAFRAAHDGRWPGNGGETAEERTLARNVRALRSEPDLMVVRCIEEKLGPLPPANRSVCNAPLEEKIVEFVRTHGRMPRHDGDTAAERNLYFRKSRSERPKKAQAGTPGASTTPTGRARTPNVARFRARTTALIEARDRLGRWPSKSSADPDERKLAFFHRSLRKPLPKQHAQVLYELDPALGRWANDVRPTKTRNLEADVIGLAAHFAKHKRMPKHTDTDKEVRRLARRLTKFRNEGITPAEALLLKRHLPQIVYPTVAEVRAQRQRAQRRTFAPSDR
jgi:hypothetical protein